MKKVMTIEEAKQFLDDLQDDLRTLVKEHPIVEDWLLEISERRIRLTKEMKSLRRMLDEKGIEWIDAFSPELPDHKYQIYRTHFSYRGYKWSVVHGYGTYGGYSPLDSIDGGLLELMSDAVNDGDPIGWLTAEEAMKYITGGKE